MLSGWRRVDICRSFFSFSFTSRDPVLTCDSMWSMSRDSFSSFCFTSSRTWGLSEVRFCQTKLELSIQCSRSLVLVNLINSVHHNKCTCIWLDDRCTIYINIEIYDIKVKSQYMYITLTIFHLFWPHVILKLFKDCFQFRKLFFG